MKRTITMVLLAMLTLAAVPIAVFADDNTGATATTSATVDAGTTADMQAMQQELTTMDNGVGAKLRLLQLERQIDIRVIEANAMIASINARNASINTTTLSDDTAELQVMITQIQTEINGITSDTDPVSQTVVDFFVTTRTDAQTAIKDFHDAAQGIVTAADRKAAADAGAKADSSLADIDAQIAQVRRDYNAARIQASLTAAGVTDDELIANVKAGNETATDALKSIRKDVLDLTPAQRKQAVSALAELAAKRRVQVLAHLDNIDKRVENATARLEDRINILQGQGKNLTAMRLQLRDNRLQLRDSVVDARIGIIQARDDAARNATQIRGDIQAWRDSHPRGNETNHTGPRNSSGNAGGDDAAGGVNADANVTGSDDNAGANVNVGVTP